jgi:glycosidase
MSRIGNRIGAEYVDFANVINLLLGSTAFVYYGQEIGMLDLSANEKTQRFDEAQHTTAAAARSPMQWSSQINTAGFTNNTDATTWLPLNDDYPYVNVQVSDVNFKNRKARSAQSNIFHFISFNLSLLKRQQFEKTSHLRVYRRLAEMRRQEASFQWGDYRTVAITREIYAFRRQAIGHRGFVVAMNFGERDVHVNLEYTKMMPEQAHVIYHISKSSDEYDQLTLRYGTEYDLVSTNKVFIKSKNCVILGFD